MDFGGRIFKRPPFLDMCFKALSSFLSGRKKKEGNVFFLEVAFVAHLPYEIMTFTF